LLNEDRKARMKSQATRCTQAQLAYLVYWQARGYSFPRDAVIPESTLTPPSTWALPSRTVLAVTAVLLAAVGVILWVSQ
jgi:hypothetical protein